MTKRMLIDATHPEETRVVVLDGSRLEEYDVETSTKKQLKGNIYLAKIVRVEPSLQAAFVEYGGNRHGFLAFGEIHPDYYQIPVADRMRLLEMQEQQAREEEAADDAAAAGQSFERGSHDRGYDRHQRAPDIEAQVESVEPGTDAQPDAQAQPLDIPAELIAARVEDDLDIPAPPADAVEITAAPEEASEFGADMVPEAMGMADEESGEDAAEDSVPEAPAPEVIGGENDTSDDTGRGVPARFLRHYKIQEVIRRRQIILIQVVKEERGNKGAALTTYISLAGRYSVLMPNSPRGGGVSRKITSAGDRKRLKEVIHELDLPRGMGLIVRTAGANRPKPEIKRDGEYLLRLWDDIRERTLQSSAPALIYEEASLIKRAIRDVYSRDVDDLLVDGEEGWKAAREFMRMLMPTHASKVVLWQDPTQKLFARHGVEAQLDGMLSPTVQLKSGGYLVINQAEALVAIDVNSGRSTRERNIEETALRTNLEAADEVARQLRLRDLAGLIVIDFIDMESKRHNAAVERRIKDALKNDRARIQVGHISSFGLLEMSRQRLRPSLAETSFIACPHCAGTGHVRSTETAAMHVMRAVEEEGAKHRAAEILVHVAGSIALYILNHKRAWLAGIETRFGMQVAFAADDSLISPQTRIDRVRASTGEPPRAVYVPIAQGMPPGGMPPVPTAAIVEDEDELAYAEDVETESDSDEAEDARRAASGVPETAEESDRRRKRRRRRRRGGRRDEGVPGSGEFAASESAFEPGEAGAIAESDAAEITGEPIEGEPVEAISEDGAAPRGRRRRGGRRRGGRSSEIAADGEIASEAAEPVEPAYVAPAYVGPTPANPFGDQAYDIFDVIEQQLMAGEATIEAQNVVAVAEPEPAPVVVVAEPEPVPEPVVAVAPEPVMQTVEPATPAPIAAPEPVSAPEPAPVAASVAAEPEPISEPLIKPILVGADGTPETKKKGWWRK